MTPLVSTRFTVADGDGLREAFHLIFPEKIARDESRSNPLGTTDAP